jgi:hypothetical protein
LLTLLFLSACAPRPIPTRTLPTAPATPTAMPIATQTAMPTVSPTTPLALPTETPTPIAYDHNPNALLIEADTSGGLAPIPADAHVPAFRLYGDGLVVFAGARTSLATGLDAQVRIGQLSETEMMGLLAALNQTSFFDLNNYYEPRPKPTDLGTGRISVFLRQAKTVRVYAPGFQGTPQAFTDAYQRILRAIPTSAQVFVPVDGYLESTDAGPATSLKPSSGMIDWLDIGVQLADAIDGMTVTGTTYNRIIELRAKNPAGALFRQGDRAYSVRFAPNLPRAVHLSDWIGTIANAPREFDGRIFELVGYFRGWNLLGEASGNPPVTRSDWVIADTSGAVYVTGALPAGLNAGSRNDIWTVIKLRAAVVYVRNGTSYLEAKSVQVVTPRATPTATPSGISSADAAINAVKAKFPEVAKIQKAAGVIGASSDIKVIERTDGWDLVFWEGSGDCPAGCINNRYQYFSVKKTGDLSKMGEYARNYNSAKNSFDVAGAPMWGIPN